VLFSAWHAQTTESNLTWGVGPVVRIATGSEVSTDTWATGITGIALQQTGAWTYGTLANPHQDFRSDPATRINATFFLPFVAYSTPEAWTFSLRTETSVDWENDAWSVPLDASVSRLAVIGGRPVNVQTGARYWLESPENGPEGWRYRLQVQFVF